MSAFSQDAVARLDYVLSDVLTLPDKTGKMIKIWTPAFHCDDAQDFMDRFVDFHEEVMAKEPIDILAIPTFLPEVLEPDYDKLWIEKRMRKIIDAAARYHVAIEINSRDRLPQPRVPGDGQGVRRRFSFGSNAPRGRCDRGHRLRHRYRKLGLKPDRFFTPGPAGRKPIQVRTLA